MAILFGSSAGPRALVRTEMSQKLVDGLSGNFCATIYGSHDFTNVEWLRRLLSQEPNTNCHNGHLAKVGMCARERSSDLFHWPSHRVTASPEWQAATQTARIRPLQEQRSKSLYRTAVDTRHWKELLWTSLYSFVIVTNIRSTNHFNLSFMT